MKGRYAQALEEYNETFDSAKRTTSLGEFKTLMQKARELEAEIFSIIWNKNHEPKRNERK